MPTVRVEEDSDEDEMTESALAALFSGAPSSAVDELLKADMMVKTTMTVATVALS